MNYLKVSEYHAKYNPPTNIIEVYRVAKKLPYKIVNQNGRSIKTYPEDVISEAVAEYEKGKRCKWSKRKSPTNTGDLKSR